MAAVIDQYDGFASLYIDGAAVAQDVVIPMYFTTYAPVANLGVFTDGTFSAASGAKIDDFQMYYGLLTPVDIAGLNGATATVSGRVALQGIADLSAVNPAAPLGSFEVNFELPGTGYTMFRANATLTPLGAGSPYGTWSVSNIPDGVYDVGIKGAKNLRVVIPNVVAFGTVSLPNMTLPGGDSNGDNGVDATDFGLFVSAYNSDSAVLGSGYDPTCDFNADGLVDMADFALLVTNYNTQGAY